MRKYLVEPLIGVGPVLLGMSRDEVRRVMSEPSEPFRKVMTSQHEIDSFHQCGFQVSYCGDQPTVEFIELSRDSGFCARYRDLDVFSMPADDVVAYIALDAAFDETDWEIPYSYIFRELQLALWRPLVPKSDTDTEGRYFMTIGVGRAGYYDEAD
jgi:hypothetical protein